MKNIVVLGGNGYIGKEIIQQLLNNENELKIYNVNRSLVKNTEDAVISIVADASDYSSLEKSLPEKVDYLINLTYGNFEITKNIRQFAETHHVKRIGNINAKVNNPEFAKFVKMKNDDLAYLLKGDIPVTNYDLTIAYGKGRNDDLQKAIEDGHWNDEHPVRVDLVAGILLNDLFQDWLK